MPEKIYSLPSVVATPVLQLTPHKGFKAWRSGSLRLIGDKDELNLVP